MSSAEAGPLCCWSNGLKTRAKNPERDFAAPRAKHSTGREKVLSLAPWVISSVYAHAT